MNCDASINDWCVPVSSHAVPRDRIGDETGPLAAVGARRGGGTMRSPCRVNVAGTRSSAAYATGAVTGACSAVRSTGVGGHADVSVRSSDRRGARVLDAGLLWRTAGRARGVVLVTGGDGVFLTSAVDVSASGGRYMVLGRRWRLPGPVSSSGVGLAPGRAGTGVGADAAGGAVCGAGGV